FNRSPAKAGAQPAAGGSASRCVWAPAFAGVRSSQPLQRRAQPFGFSRFGLMVRARFLDRLGLGALGEVGVGKALSEAVALFFGSRGAFQQARFLGFEVDKILKREDVCSLTHDDLRLPANCDAALDTSHSRQ